jgi:hypothetical protein
MSLNVWSFFDSDNDHSTGWDNHCLILAYVTSGIGATPQQAWEEALASDRLPPEYPADEPPGVAIPLAAIETVQLGTPHRRWEPTESP